MIIEFPKRMLFTLPRVKGREIEESKPAAPRMGFLQTFARLMERHADLIVRGMGE